MDKELLSSATAVRDAVKEELALYLAQQRDYLTGIASEMVPVCDALEDYLLEGGKRLRPLLHMLDLWQQDRCQVKPRSALWPALNYCRRVHLFMMT